MSNRVQLTGRLTRDAEIGTTSKGLPFCRLRLASSRLVNGGQEADYHDVVVWRAALAEQCAKLPKGALVSVDGRIDTRSWTDREGKTREQVRLVAWRVRLLQGPHAAAAPVEVAQ